jgi:hypothetical protein
MQITTLFHIIDIMHIITVFRIVVCFHRGCKGTIKGLGSCVCRSRGREQEQYSRIPDSIGRDYKRPSFDTQRLNHDEVHSVTAVKRFRWKQVTINPLHTTVLGVSDLQTIVKSKMTLALC